MTGLLLISNYSNTTGYAWSNIYNLFDFIASDFSKDNITTHVSFAQIAPPVNRFEHVTGDFLQYNPYDSDARESLKLLRYVLQNNIKYIYLTDQPLFRPLYLVLRLCGVRTIICHSRVSVPNPYPATKETGFKGLAKFFQKRIPGFTVDKVYAVSSFVGNRIALKSRFPKRKIEVILNGIDICKFSPEGNLNRNNSNDLTVFACGRATPHKGIDILIRALKIISTNTEMKHIKVVYAGDGPYLNKYQQLSQSLGVGSFIKFAGEVPSTDQFLKECDIACIPSAWGDACPSSVSEAMASGRPVITTRAGGIPEIVGSEENAVLIEPGQAEPLADAIIELARDPEKRALLSKRARKRAESALSLKQYYAKVIWHLRTDLDIQAGCR